MRGDEKVAILVDAAGNTCGVRVQGAREDAFDVIDLCMAIDPDVQRVEVWTTGDDFLAAGEREPAPRKGWHMAPRERGVADTATRGDVAVPGKAE